MRLAVSAGRRVLVVAPHPDDEVIGAWGLIRATRLAGGDVRVVVASDGAASHRASRVWPAQRLVRQRRREALWGLRTLGLTTRCVRFLGLPDGRLEACGDVLRAALRRELLGARAPHLLVGPTRDDDHPDHRAVAAAMDAVAPPRLRRLAYGVWAGHATPATAQACRAPVGGAAMAKRFALRLHRSQAGLVTDDPEGFALTAAQVAAFTRPVETFRQDRRPW